MAIAANAIDAYDQYSMDKAGSYGGFDPYPNPDRITHNNQYDAYRHALMSAQLAEMFGEDFSKMMMDVKWTPRSRQ
ncbi:MAG: hypothetical protein PHU06_10315 [Gallionella sp.]|nr:hypothetical protein [Gallionella sp.]MDD4958922.1 hypothetical protein [Gallionella sp.]